MQAPWERPDNYLNFVVLSPSIWWHTEEILERFASLPSGPQATA